MTIRVALHHKTSYQYDRPVAMSPHVVRLRPAPHCRTPVVSYSLKVEPKDHFVNWQQDPHGNFLARFVFPNKADKLSFEVDLVAELTVFNPFDFFLEAEAETFPFKYDDWLATELAPYLLKAPAGKKFQDFVDAAPCEAKRTIDFVVELNRYVHEAVKYLIRLEPGVQTCDETLEKGSGSCRDSAWLLVQTFRQLGLAARFVSGYLIQLQPDVKPLDGPAGAAHDFTDLHAWTEVYLPGAGWVGLDATSGLLTGEGHLPLAATPDPVSAAPITGAVDEAKTEFAFEMTVERIHEDPRVTKPYTDEEWVRIEALGHEVDRRLEAGDVRLTMGGEPTFVSVDDMEGAEWNFTAMGPNKRKLAGTLFDRLAEVFSHQPLLHYGQGKWYPGEQLPRWALGCYWRKDGAPIWRDAKYIAADNQKYAFDADDARTFITRLAERLKVDREHAIAAYEDVWYYMWKERRLPVNVDPLKSKLTDIEERKRLARIFDEGLGRVVGFALPIRAKATYADRTEWESGPWFLRQEHMFLIPGDSPMGLRLPLDSLPWVAPEDIPMQAEPDPFESREPLPIYSRQETDSQTRRAALARNYIAERERVLVHQFMGLPDRSSGDGVRQEHGGNGNGNGNGHGGDELSSLFGEAAGEEELNRAPIQYPLPHRSAKGLVRTALCVQAREGTLYVFMPPATYLEDYLHLIAAVEATAADLQMPVRIEGYPPPHDHRIQHFKVTPDPGVIEVNLQPAENWEELAKFTTVLYEEARQSRLGTEKFMVDGRHTGTGGGNHIVLGGAKPSDSPFLRRPDLLRSLITYWNNRPSLSYVFSGLFIGPTSQAPRVDEARHESIYEMETAFTQLPQDGQARPWLIDRVLRNLLVDLTGNTHRAEFCIDKLYSPDSSSGRLGLVEFRAFEMPPHARMSLAQQLLVRALVTRFWEKPYQAPLVRWRTTLHDKFMLPHFVAQDFAEVIEEMNDAGFAFEQSWFNTHFEFRFPVIGRFAQRGIQVEIRQGIEPWHVLGEEPAGGGTARHVDSSLERVQVKVQGMTDPRHVLVCNGRRVPLHPTGVPGEFVAGIRYRAWQPPSCLHPTIGVHAPLVFDLFDGWNGRSIGGCTWHVAHPGGRAFEDFPINAYAAESRRVARFFAIGHTPGKFKLPPEETNPDYPFTLDLRRPVQGATLNP